MFGPQRDGRIDPRRRPCQPKLPALRQRCQHQRTFHQRKPLADAPARPAAKWKVRELRSPVLPLRKPPIGIELLRLTKVSRIAMNRPRAHDDERAGAQTIPRCHVILRCHPSDEPRRRIQAQRLGEDHPREGKIRHVIVGRRARPENGVQFCVEPSLGRGGSCEQIPGPRQCVGRGLVPPSSSVIISSRICVSVIPPEPLSIWARSHCDSRSPPPLQWRRLASITSNSARSSRARAALNRRALGSGKRLISSRPIPAACASSRSAVSPSRSAANNVRPAIASVRWLIARAISMTCPSCQRSRCAAAISDMVSPYAASRGRWNPGRICRRWDA